MSENHFYNDDFDFEQLIKQKSDQFKMYPSAQVWKGIHSALHTPLSWYVTGLFLVTAAITLYILDPFTPSSKVIAQQKPLKAQSSKNAASAEEASIIPFSQSVIAASIKSRKRALVVDEKIEDINEEPSSTASELSLTKDASKDLIPLDRTEKVDLLHQNTNIQAVAKVISITTDLRNSTPRNEQAEAMEGGFENDAEPISGVAVTNAVSAIPDPAVLDEEHSNKLNIRQEIAIQSIAKPKLTRSRWQLSVSPTMNFRLLRNNTEVITASNNQVIPIALKVKGDVNQYVKHMPAVGLEVGSLYLFNINSRWSLKVGGQFNFSRYYIQAFNTNIPEIAKINLGTSTAGIGTTPITSYSKIRNLSGNSYKGIQNQYYQVSSPVGLEYVLLGKRKLQLNIAATLQPTFLLNRNSYLITTDYKNYTRQPSLVRQWNLNTSGEAFISYKATHYKFQLGPQFRYQLFSTFEQKYPIKEYLMEYGVKLAITR